MKKHACDTLRGCLGYLEHHWLKPNGYSLGTVKALGDYQHSVDIHDKKRQRTLSVSIHHAGAGDWDISSAVWDIQLFAKKEETCKVASRTESVT